VTKLQEWDRTPSSELPGRREDEAPEGGMGVAREWVAGATTVIHGDARSQEL
jgi:hypothetical protein